MHCKQLPLALRVMGSVAAGFHTMAEWQSCVQKLQKTGSSLGGGYDKELFDVLRKSYDNLDDAGKSLFFCLVGYPDDCYARVSDVVEQWMALQNPDGQESEAAELLMDGYAVFEQLLHQSLVYLDGSGVEESCIMHGLVREMGLRIAKEENENMAETGTIVVSCVATDTGAVPQGKRAVNLWRFCRGMARRFMCIRFDVFHCQRLWI